MFAPQAAFVVHAWAGGATRKSSDKPISQKPSAKLTHVELQSMGSFH